MLVEEPVIIVLTEYLKNGKLLTDPLTDNLISRDASASKKGQRFSEESYGGAALVDFLAYRWQYLRLVLPVHKYMLQRHFSPFFQTNTKSNLL